MKIKEFAKSYLIGLILGIVVSGTISVIAETYFPSNDVTYDNTESGLSSTNVQGAIDELYGVCTTPATPGDAILDNVDIVTSGDGLYEDEYEEGKYTYKGANPNNYVTFNNESAGWRIISINSDGTIKIMRTADININDNLAWDTSGNNNWARPANLNTYLNSTYYNGLSSTAQSQIVAEDWSIGAVTRDNNDLSDQINDENGTKWNGKVALATVSEYIRSNSNKSSCGTFGLNSDNFSSCRVTTWMYYSSDSWWTLSPNAYYSDSSYDSTYYIAGSDHLIPGSILNSSISASTTDFAVRPVVYLSSEVTLSGSGTQSDPYQIK